MKNTIVWFQKDLRLHDNPALYEAALRGAVIPVFIWSRDEEEGYYGEASLWWLHQSLQSLRQALQSNGVSLIIRAGNTLDELRDIVQQTGADAVFFNERYEPAMAGRESFISDELRLQGIEVRAFSSHLLLNQRKLFNIQNEPYKIFTPFWKRCLKEAIPRPVPLPDRLHEPELKASSLTVEQLGLLPEASWYYKFSLYWQPGEKEAIQRWSDFAENELLAYENGRDYPYKELVSRLSPYLAWGNISVSAIWHAAASLLQQAELEGNVQLQRHADAFLRQLIWREFGYHIMLHYPEMLHTPVRRPFLAFPWQMDEDNFERWKRGKTGYPLVDAGMRELWETGTVHNRVRMVAASFLVKHLLIPWTKGAEWFRDTLVDYDPANNAMGWQWVAGCGFDAAPYFRIFNPVTQSEKFDEHGHYIRKWVPDLAKLEGAYIHKPWTAPADVLAAAGIKLGDTYPYPMIEHRFARERALEAYEAIKQGNNPR